jgi:hypothetical protein
MLFVISPPINYFYNFSGTIKSEITFIVEVFQSREFHGKRKI